VIQTNGRDVAELLSQDVSVEASPLVAGGQGRAPGDVTLSAFVVAWAMAAVGIGFALALGVMAARVAGY
jgi:hypothetical protein